MALDVSGTNSLYWKTGINNAGLMTGSTQAKGILRGLAGAITKMDVFAGLAIGSAIIFAKISKQAYNFSKEFETAMKEVQTISKAVQNNFEGISKEIIDMSKTVPDNAQKLTKALYQIVSAGYDGAEAMKILRISTELATASVTDTFTAADALTYVMNAYGEAAGTAADISDKLFTIVRLGKVKMEELGPTISMVTGLAAQAGLGFNELAAMYAEAVKKIQPHIVSTGIRGILTAMLRVSKGTGEAADKARELGIEFDISALKSKGFKQILSEIIIATKGNEGALMELFPNVRGLIGLLAVMTDEGEAYNKTLNEIENSTGATDKAFATMMDTTENQLAILHNNVMAKLKPLGDSILKSMNNIARGINQVMSGATDEITRLSDTYSRLAATLEKKKNRIDDLVNTIETLRNKTKLSKEETIELEAAEKSLAVYYPNLVIALNGATHSLVILNEAKRDSLELTKKIAEVELAKAELEVKKANIELMKLRRDEAEASKEVENLAEKVGRTGDLIIGMVTRSMEEFIRGIKMYPTDDFTKEIERLEQAYKEAGIVVENLGGRLKEIQKDLKLGLGEEAAEKQKELIDDVVGAALEGSDEYQEAMYAWGVATGEVTIKMEEQKNIIDENNISIDAYKKIIEETKEALSKPIIIPRPESKYGLPPKIPEGIIIPTLTDEQIKDAEDKLKYMASQYKKYMSDVAEFGEEDVRKRNKLLAEEGSNYAQFLSDMAIKYKDNAELNRQISDEIYEYNNGLITKRKEAEEKLFELIATDREKDLQAEKDKFDDVIKNYEEGSSEYLEAVEKHNKIVLEINDKYNKEMAETALTIFKENLEQQIGELNEHYKQRLEIARTGLYKETEANKEYFEFVMIELNKLAIIKEEKAKEDQATLDSYFESYQTTEEKIISIHKKTNELLLLTDDKYEKERLKNITKQKVAEIEFADAKQKIDDKLAEFGEDLNNEELENKIKVLEAMKLEYANYSNEVIKLNKEIADSQEQIWENTRDEISKTVDTLHTLAEVVANFDTELEKTINDVANIVSGIGEITIGISTGGIAGIISGIFTIMQSIFSIFSSYQSTIKELNAELRKITLELQKQQNILSQSLGTERLEAIQDTIDLLEEQIAVYNEMIIAEEERWKTDQEKIDEWLSSIESANAEIANLWQQYREILTGTTAESIADAIAEGFSEGLTSAEVFADTFNDMMKKAIIDAFKRTIITKYIEDWYDQFVLLSGGGLTAEEIEALTGTYQEMIEAAEAQWEALATVLEEAGIELSEEVKREGLTGAIAGITEETAGLLAGQFQAIRINTVDILSNMENIIIINSRIADNTEYNKYLEHISDKLDEKSSLESEYLRSIGGA